MAIDNSMLPIPPSIEGPSPADSTDSVRVMYVDSVMGPEDQPIARVASMDFLFLDSAPNLVIIFGPNRSAKAAS